MDAKQKKIIAGTFFTILAILGTVGVVLGIYGFIAKDEVAHIVGIATAGVSPSLLIGLASKGILGKIQEKKTIRQIDDLLVTTGVKSAPKEAVKPIKINKSEISGTPGKTIQGFEIYYDVEQGGLLIKIPAFENKHEYLQSCNYVFKELNEEFRKMG